LSQSTTALPPPLSPRIVMKLASAVLPAIMFHPQLLSPE